MTALIRLLVVIALGGMAGVHQAMCQRDSMPDNSVFMQKGPSLNIQVNPPTFLPSDHFGAPRTRSGPGPPPVAPGFKHLEELKKQDPRYGEQIFPDIVKTANDIEIHDLCVRTEVYATSKSEYQRLLDDCAGLQSAQKVTDELVKSSETGQDVLRSLVKVNRSTRR